jgi:hypothetical protein
MNAFPRNPKTRREISPESIEMLAAEGFSLDAMAKSLGFKYQTLAKRINDSFTLSEAYRRGKERFKHSANVQEEANG